MKCFLQKIQASRVYRDLEDRVIWTTSRCGTFSVKSLKVAFLCFGSILGESVNFGPISKEGVLFDK